MLNFVLISKIWAFLIFCKNTDIKKKKKGENICKNLYLEM